MLTLTRYEQSAFVLVSDTARLAVDFGSYVQPDNLAMVGHPDAALVSHIHPDHFNETNLAQFEAPIYSVQEVATRAQEAGLAVQVAKEGDWVTVGDTGFEVLFTASNHGPNVGLVENVGFLLKSGGTSVYFLGDMAVSTPAPLAPYDVVLIPVGGRGYTFDPELAFEHIQKIGWHGLTVPIHYDGSADPDAGLKFAELAKDACEVRVMAIGDSLEL